MLEVIVPSYTLVYDKKAVTKTLRQAANEIANAARKLIRSNKSGDRRRGSHTVSAPGQPPADRTGLLAGSIRTRVRTRGTVIVATVRDTATDKTGYPYSVALEGGAYGGGGAGSRQRVHRRRSAAQRKASATTQRVLEPRPFLSAALEQTRPSVAPRLSAAILDGMDFKPSKKAKTGESQQGN